ncbi:hypothetical protein MBLNU459_g1323t1 [Dothideomycetes sp. NU459]
MEIENEEKLFVAWAVQAVAERGGSAGLVVVPRKNGRPRVTIEPSWESVQMQEAEQTTERRRGGCRRVGAGEMGWSVNLEKARAARAPAGDLGEKWLPKGSQRAPKRAPKGPKRPPSWPRRSLACLAAPTPAQKAKTINAFVA